VNVTAGKINVGVTISVNEGGSMWDSGLNQNLVFLLILLRQIPEVGKIYMLNGGSAEKLPPSMAFDTEVPLVRAQDVTHDLDLIIEVGASMPIEWMRHQRALGTSIVTLFVGHVYSGQAENPMFGLSGGPAFIGTPWNEIWTLPQHMKTSGPLLRTIGRVPVREMPHIWSPMFVQQHIDTVTKSGVQFGFQPKPGVAWRVAIFEPNISVVKNCFIPMLVCDQAYRQNSESIGHMMVMNTFFMKDHPTFNRLAVNLDLTRDSKASYEPRLAFVECMAHHKIDAVVAHQWECGLNYAYYDALFGGYPLIHNSEFLEADGIGIYYPGFEAVAGAQAFIDAWQKDPAFWASYRSKAAAYLQKLAPEHPRNVSFYRDRILSLVGERHGN
jgi:hypothetical protein